MRRFGIEIEGYNVDRYELARRLNDAGIRAEVECYNHRVQNGYWKLVTDGSIHGNLTFELVSPPLTDFNELRTVCRVLTEANAKVNRSCGTHVHIEVNDLNAEHLANVIRRYGRHEDEIDSFMAPSRRLSNNTFCCSVKNIRLNNVSSTWDIANEMGSRYYKVNFQAYIKYGTLEFRQHQGTIDFVKISNWVLFLNSFIASSAPVTGTVNLTSRTAKGRSVIDCLMTQDNPTPASIAAATGLDARTVRSIVRRLREQADIPQIRGIYRIARTAATRAADSLWTNVNDEVRRFFEARINHFNPARAAA